MFQEDMEAIPRRRIVHLSTVLLVVIGLVDLISTIAWLELGGHEGNPLFRGLLNHGVAAFALGKIVFLAGPIAILEYARRKAPHSAEAGTWIAFGFYALLWGFQLLRLSHMLR